MYPNYGQQPGNIGFNPNTGQQQGPSYPGAQQGGGVPYPAYPPQNQPGFGQTPYPNAPGVQPPPLPGQQPGYAPFQPSAYSQTQAPTPAYPPAPGYPQTQSPNYPPQAGGGAYPSQTGAYSPQTGGYQQAGGYPPQGQGAGYPYSGIGAQPQGGAPSWPQGQGYQPQPPQGQGQAYPPQGQGGYQPQPQPPQGQPGGYQSAYPSTTYPNTAYPAQSYGQAPLAPTSASGYYNDATPYSSAPAAHLGQAHGAGGNRMQAYVEKPTIHPPGHFDPAGDAQALRKAMKGFGTDENAILNVICKRTNMQRLQISQAYKTSFGKDLMKDLRGELGGRFEDVVVALMTPRFDFLAMTVQKAISGIGTKERSLVDVLCTGSNEEIRMISASYTRLFGRTLERELMGDTSGHFRRLLVSITAAGRMENQPPDQAMAANDAKALFEAGTKKIGTDESTFNQILCMRSFPHLRLVFQEYERTYGRSFEKVIENEFSGDIESGMKALVACARNRAAYFATRLHESFAGLGTKDDDLIFIMATRCEIDLQNIKEEYQRNYNKTLSSAISSETSGDYKKALIALLGE